MASLIDELKRESITIRWLLLTIIGGATNSILWSQYLFFSQHIFSDIMDLLVYSLFFAFIGISYCIVSSLSLPEKRIVAPSDTQIASFPIILTIGFVTLRQSLADYAFIMLMSFLLLYVLGLVQNRFVTGIVGIYGTSKDCCCYFYSTDMSVDELSKKLREEAFAKATDITQSKQLKKAKTKVFLIPFGEGCQVFLFLKPEQKENASHCLINVIGYERTRYGIRKSLACENKTQMVISLLSKLCKTKEVPKEDEFYETSMRYAIQPTRNKLQSKRISLNITLTCLIAVFIILPIALFRVGYLPSLESLAVIEIANVLAVLLDLTSRLKK
jgi:hypothetical protein